MSCRRAISVTRTLTKINLSGGVNIVILCLIKTKQFSAVALPVSRLPYITTCRPTLLEQAMPTACGYVDLIGFERTEHIGCWCKYNVGESVKMGKLNRHFFGSIRLKVSLLKYSVISVREYAFYVFFRFKKRDFLTFFWNDVSKNSKKVVSKRLVLQS